MNEQEILFVNGEETRSNRLPHPHGIRNASSGQSIQSVGVGPSNIMEIVAGSQVKIDKVLADVSERLAAVEARVGFREKIVITPDMVMMEREVTMEKDRKY